MTTYIAMMKMTPKGRVEIADSLNRGDFLKEKFKKLGVTRTAYYMTIGTFDCLMFFDAPNENVMMQALLEIGRLGAVETNTLTAISNEEYTRMLQDLASE